MYHFFHQTSRFISFFSLFQFVASAADVEGTICYNIIINGIDFFISYKIIILLLLFMLNFRNKIMWIELCYYMINASLVGLVHTGYFFSFKISLFKVLEK